MVETSDTKYVPRMRTKYDTEIVKAMTEKFGYKNAMEVPKISKVALADPRDGKPTRVRFETKDGKKLRVAVKSGETIDG